MNVVLLGQSSSAAKGLPERIRAQGNTCVTFGRGAPGRAGDAVTGPIEGMSTNPFFPERSDWLLNFIILRDRSIADNVTFCREVLALARRLRCRGVVHLSSIMSLQASRIVSAKTPVDPHYERRPEYAAVKMATDSFLLAHAEGTPVVFVTPGFILAPGHVGVTIGSAAALPGGTLLVLGNPKQRFPVITRADVQDVVLKTMALTDAKHGERFLAVSPESPTRGEYVELSAALLGQARRVVSLGAWFWYPAALAGEVLARLSGQASPKILQRIHTTFRRTAYDSSATRERLGAHCTTDWRSAMQGAYDGQTPNFVAPPAPREDSSANSLKKILFAGFGAIVLQKHLPALQQLGFAGSLDIYDPARKQMPNIPFPFKQVANISESDATVCVVASPPASHTEVLSQLPVSVKLVLVEKPVVVQHAEFQIWLAQERAGARRHVAIHNYRMKQNVLRFLAHVQRRNPGELRGCRVIFDTGPIHCTPVVWRKNERASKTLLYDFGLHSLDLACIFGGQYEGVRELDWSLDAVGNTATIAGLIRFSNYPVTFHLRQGHGITRHEVHFDFANYSVRLTFNPDTFIALHGQDMIVNRFREGWADVGFISRWMFAKLRHREADRSHARVFQEGIASMVTGGASPLSVESLARCYTILEDIGKTVYG